MKKYTLLGLLITAVFVVSVSAQVKTHSVWTNDNGLVIGDAQTGCEYYSLAAFDMASSWTEPTPGYPAQAHFRGVSKAYGYSFLCSSDHFYEFSLHKSGSVDSDSIKGAWDVYRDGVLVCAQCDGIAYAMSGSAGSGAYYKLHISDPVYAPAIWYYIGYIDQRKDF